MVVCVCRGEVTTPGEAGGGEAGETYRKPTAPKAKRGHTLKRSTRPFHYPSNMSAFPWQAAENQNVQDQRSAYAESLKSQVEQRANAKLAMKKAQLEYVALAHPRMHFFLPTMSHAVMVRFSVSSGRIVRMTSVSSASRPPSQRRLRARLTRSVRARRWLHGERPLLPNRLPNASRRARIASHRTKQQTSSRSRRSALQSSSETTGTTASFSTRLATTASPVGSCLRSTALAS